MGKPIRIRSDGGPQFRSSFKNWCKEQDIIHELTSPYNHQANGMAEVTVREMKKLLEKTGQNWPKFQSALREYRNTPRFDGMSPAQWLFSHRQRTNAMAIPNAYARVTDEMFKKHLDLRGCEQSRIAERVHSSKPEQFHPGAKVWIQDPKNKRWSVEAVIVSGISKRTFRVNDGTREFMRNRRFIRPRIGTADGPLDQ